MGFTAALIVPAVEPFEEVVRKIGTALGVTFVEDTSGRYEEFPAVTAFVLGMEIAILGLPDDCQVGQSVDDNYSIIVQSHADADDDHDEVDVGTPETPDIPPLVLMNTLETLAKSGKLPSSCGDALGRLDVAYTIMPQHWFRDLIG